MDISQLATKPKLVKLEVDTPEVIEQVGESIVFYMKEHLDLGTYFDFYKLQEKQDMNMLMEIMKKIILKEDGTQAIQEDEILPVELSLPILYKINDYVGKSKAKTSAKTTGEEQN